MELKKRYIIEILYYGLIMLLVIIFFKYIFGIVFPLFIGLFIAILSQKMTVKHKIARLKRNSNILYVTLILFVAFFVLCTFFYFLTKNMSYLLVDITNITHEFLEKNQLSKFYILQYILEFFAEIVSFISKYVLSFITSILKTLPQFVINILLVVLSAYYFALNYCDVRAFLLRYIKNKRAVIKAKNIALDIVFCLFKAYFTIFCINFSILFFGLWIIKIQNYMEIAFIVALFDLIPGIGVGIMLIPWILYEYTMKNMRNFLILSIIYGLCLICKNFIEPKVISSKIGTNMLETVICIILGAKLFGFLGIIFAPFALILIKNIACTK